jgi:hypothetical protein
MRTSGNLSVAAGTLTASVAHGINTGTGNPDLLIATPTADTQGRVWWITVDATNITVTLDANAVTSPITFDWVAETTA